MWVQVTSWGVYVHLKLSEKSSKVIKAILCSEKSFGVRKKSFDDQKDIRCSEKVIRRSKKSFDTQKKSFDAQKSH